MASANALYFSLLRIIGRVRFPYYNANRCGHERQAPKSCCKFNKFKLKLLLTVLFPVILISFYETLFFSSNGNLSSYFKLFSRVKSSRDENVRFIKGNELNLTQVESFSFFHFKSAYFIFKDQENFVSKGIFLSS